MSSHGGSNCVMGFDFIQQKLSTSSKCSELRNLCNTRLSVNKLSSLLGCLDYSW